MFKTLRATWLCLKYPFIYPRNRFTGLHYNNWKILEFMQDLRKKYFVFQKPKFTNYRPWYYKYEGGYEYFWKNWWALPLYSVIDFIHSHPLQWIHCLTNYTELDAIPKVWEDDFGLEWCKDVKKFLKDNNIKHYRISQLKEKWGEFDWLYPPIGAEAIEDKYIKRSKSICCCCGRPATHMTTGWISYYCEKCAPCNAEPINAQ